MNVFPHASAICIQMQSFAVVLAVSIAVAIATVAAYPGTPAMLGLSFSYSEPSLNLLVAYDPIAYTPLPTSQWTPLAVPTNMMQGMQQPVATFDQESNRWFMITQSNEYRAPNYLWSISTSSNSAEDPTAPTPSQLLNIALPLPVSNISIDGWWENPGCVGYEPFSDTLIFVYSIYDFSDSNLTIVAQIDATTGQVLSGQYAKYTIPVSNTNPCVYDRISHTVYGIVANTDTSTQDWYAISVPPGSTPDEWTITTGLFPKNTELNHCVSPVIDPYHSGKIWLGCSHYPGLDKSQFHLSVLDMNAAVPQPVAVSEWTTTMGAFPGGVTLTMDGTNKRWFGHGEDALTSGSYWLVADLTSPTANLYVSHLLCLIREQF